MDTSWGRNYQQSSWLAGQSVVASLVWVGADVSPEIVEKVRSLWTLAERQGEAGVTRQQLGYCVDIVDLPQLK